MLETLSNLDTFHALVALAGFLTGLAYAIGGSGGLIITPMLIALGIPIHTAIGSAKMGTITLILTVFLKFRHSSTYIQTRQLIPLTIIALLCAFIGANITLSLDKEIIYPIVGVFLALLSPLALIKKDFGLQSYTPTSLQKILGYSSYALVMIFGGFFGAGAGIPGILALVSFLGFTVLQAHSTLSLPFLAINILSATLFALHGHVDYTVVLILTITTAIGGYIGTKFALKQGETWVKYFTCGFACLFGIKMVIESVTGW